jgi:hypothetical protein
VSSFVSRTHKKIGRPHTVETADLDDTEEEKRGLVFAELWPVRSGQERGVQCTLGYLKTGVRTSRLAVAEQPKNVPIVRAVDRSDSSGGAESHPVLVNHGVITHR